jgi:phage replication O-like protein O
MNNKNYTQTPNKLLEKLAKTKLSNYEFRCICVVVRKTFGWRKEKGDYISLSQFVKEIGIKKSHVCRTLRRLIKRKILIKREKKLAINLNFNEWIELPNQVTVTKLGPKVTSLSNKIASLGTYKIHLSKNNKQKKDNFSSNEELLVAYKSGDRRYKPFYHDNPMRYFKDSNRWEVCENGEWKEFAGSEKEIEFKKKKDF